MSNSVEYIISLRDKFSSKLSNIKNQISNLEEKTSVFNGVAGELSGVLGGIGFAAAAASVVTLGVNMEQTRVAFSTFLGDAGKANKLLDELNQFANVTPYDNAGVIEAGKSLLAMGVNASDITSTLTRLGDVASGVNVPLNEMAQIYGKAMNKGKLQAEELNQLSERGVPIIDALAKKFGTTKTEVYKFAEQGKITFEVFKEAFNGMSNDGGMFFQMMEKQSKTTGGRWSTLVGEAQKLGITIGEKLLPIISSFVDMGMKLATWMNNNINLIMTTISVVLKLAKYYLIYLTVLKATSIALQVAKIATTAYRLAMIALNGGITKAMTSIKGFKMALASTGIGIAVIGITYLIEKYMEYKDAVSGATKKQKDFNKSLDDYWSRKKIIENLGLGSVFYESNLKGMIDEIKELENAGQNWSEIPLEFNKNLSTLNKGQLETTISYFDDLISQASKFAKIGKNDIYSKAVKFFTKIRNKTQEQLNKVTTSLGVQEGNTNVEQQTKETKITSSAPRVFNINIDKLVENFTVSTNTLKESTGEIKEAVLNALLGSLNDTQIVLNQ